MTSIDYYGTVKGQGYDVDPRSVLIDNPNAGPAELEELCRCTRIEAEVKVKQLRERRQLRT